MRLAAVSGQKTTLAGTTPKGKPWPYYYGIQPTGFHPDEPFIRELYWSNAARILSGAAKFQPNVPLIQPVRLPTASCRRSPRPGRAHEPLQGCRRQPIYIVLPIRRSICL
jgi:hypothetical protein